MRYPIFETITHDENGVWVALVPQELSTNTSFQMQRQTKRITEETQYVASILPFSHFRDASSLKFAKMYFVNLYKKLPQ